MDYIPVHIGADALKRILYNAIIPRWNSWANNFLLHIDQITMRDKLWVILKPTAPDRDVISRHFFRSGRKGAQIFKTGKTIINFHVPNEVHNAMLDKKLDDELQTEQRAVAARDNTIKNSLNHGADFTVCGFIKLQGICINAVTRLVKTKEKNVPEVRRLYLNKRHWRLRLFLFPK